MKHQAEALRRRSRRPRKPSSQDVFADIMDMGTGKSKVILDEWQEKVSTGELDALLVIAPAGSYKNWFEDKSDLQRAEINVHLDPALRKRMLIAPWVGGAENKRARERAIRTKDRPRAMFVNVEAFSQSDRAYDQVVAFLEGSRAMIAIDESTVIMRNSSRTKSVLSLALYSRCRRIMTGLVTPRSPMDLFYQFFFLDWRILGHEKIQTFKAHYAVTERSCFIPHPQLMSKLMSMCEQRARRAKSRDLRSGWLESREKVRHMKRAEVIDKIIELGGWVQHSNIIKGYKNMEELQARIAPYSFRVLKEDCLDLAPKTYKFWDVELTAEQKRIYKDLRDKATSEIDEGRHVTATMAATKLIRMHQVICGHVVDEQNKVSDVDSNRVAAVLEILGEHSGQAIIWATYRREVAKIAAAIERVYGRGSCAQFHGGNKKERGEDEREFIAGRRPYIVASQRAGGLGNTWIGAGLSIYAANDYDLQYRLQSEDRNHRKGQTQKVTYVDVIARGTVEYKIVEALRRKIDLATQITGEKLREWLI